MTAHVLFKKKLQNMADKQGDLSPHKPSEIDSYTETFDPFEDSSGH